MLFADLQLIVLNSLRARVRNGELTERRLARLVGVSQPHIHNVLKGSRILSPRLADQILTGMKLSLYDMFQQYAAGKMPELAVKLEQISKLEAMYELPILDGPIGPGHPWPSGVDSTRRYPVPASALATMVSPVVARLAEDNRMLPIFTGGDMALLDRDDEHRTHVENDCLYLVRSGRSGVVRRLRTSGRSIYIVTEDSLDCPSGWERIPTEVQSLTNIILARATLLDRDPGWH